MSLPLIFHALTADILSCLAVLSISQKVPNNAAHLVLRVPQTDQIPLFLSHWLPIDLRIQYKLASLCYNCLSMTAPAYRRAWLNSWKFTNQAAMYIERGRLCFSFSVILPFLYIHIYCCCCLLSVRRSHSLRQIFLLLLLILQRLSRKVSFAKLDH